MNNRRKLPFTAKIAQFFAEADKYAPESIDKNIIELVNYTSQYVEKKISCKGDFSLLTNLPNEQLKDLETLAIDSIGVFITVKAVLIFARAVRLLHYINEYNDKTDKDSRNRRFDIEGKEAVNPFGLKIQVTVNGVKADWYNRHAELRWQDYPKRWENEPEPNKEGNYTMYSFTPATRSVKEFIYPTFESVLQGLRDKTKWLGVMREELDKYRTLSGINDRKSISSFKDAIKTYAANSSIPRIEPDVDFMITDASTFEGGDFKEVQGDEYYLDYSFDDLKERDNEADRNIVFFLRLLRTVMFIKGAKIFDYYYTRKKIFISQNGYTRKGRIRMPYHPAILLSPNGVSISWNKMLYSASNHGLLRTAEHMVPKHKGRYLRGDFKGASSKAQKFICDEIEPQFVVLRSQTTACSAIRRDLRWTRLIHEKYYQKGSNRVG